MSTILLVMIIISLFLFRKAIFNFLVAVYLDEPYDCRPSSSKETYSDLYGYTPLPILNPKPKNFMDYALTHNHLTKDLPWDEYKAQLREKHEKLGYPSSWTNIHLKIAQETNQGFVEVILNDLSRFEVYEDKIAIFHMGAPYIAEAIRCVSYEKVMEIVRSELPQIETIRLEICGGEK